MLHDSAKRMTAYTGLATVVAAGGAVTSEVNADLMIFDVGQTLDLTRDPEADAYIGSYMIGMNIAGNSVEANIKAFQVRSNFSTSQAQRLDLWKVAGPAKGSQLMFGKSQASKDAPNLLANFEDIGQVGSSFEGSAFPFAKGGFRIVDPSGSKADFGYGQFEGRFYVGFTYADVDSLQGGDIDFYAGWIELTLGQDGDFLSLTIDRWAYESTPGQAASIPGGTPVPGVGGLLALAMGAAGVRGRRQRVA